MSLDPRFVLAPSLEMYFVDKDTGLPLAGGKVYFFKDQARNEPKPVFKISGTPPNYSYTELPNPCILSGVGTFQDDEGNDILPYYFPYEGTPDESDGTVELYYVVVTSADDVPQFTREGWPNTTIDGGNNPLTNTINYVPNGQFITHNNLPATDVYSAGEIRAGNTKIAPGFWTFDRPDASTAVDILTFQRFGSYTTNPTDSPRYAVRINNQTPGADAFKDLRLEFRDVNEFASDTQQYTLSITARTNIGSAQNVGLVLIKNFGTGGSATTETTLTNYTFTSSYTIYNFVFTFGNNSGKTIGPDDDDFIQLAWRFPGSDQFSVDITDVALVLGNIDITSFPIETETQTIAQALAGSTPVPDYNAQNLYLPIRLGKNGFEYDTSIIAKIFSSGSTIIDIGELLCNGSQYAVDEYSTDGIPYSRLYNKIKMDNYFEMPRWGTGDNFITPFFNVDENDAFFAFKTNTNGTTTSAADGTTPTGFTFSVYTTGGTYGFNSNYLSNDLTALVYTSVIAEGVVTAANAGNSGFAVTADTGTPLTSARFTILTTSSTGLAGKYFEASSGVGNYYIWFKVAGSGSDPAIGGRTGIEVDVPTGMDGQSLSAVVVGVLSGNKITSVTCVAGSVIPAGSYWKFYTTLNAFYVWYTVDGVGVDPAPGGTLKGIKVAVLSTDTAAQVKIKTFTAINGTYFKVPDLINRSLVGADGFGYDRYNFIDWNILVDVGTYEDDINRQHLHSLSGLTKTIDEVTSPLFGVFAQPGFFSDPPADPGVAIAGGPPEESYPVFPLTAFDSGYEGSYQSRPKNAAVNFVIKY